VKHGRNMIVPIFEHDKSQTIIMGNIGASWPVFEDIVGRKINN
jgi:hypothetical protein